MPTYEYKCSGCSKRLEIVQRITADPLTKCEACGGQLKRVVFPVGVVYKGTGFYTTDYARKNGGSDKSEDTPKPEAEAATTEKKAGDSEKPAPTTSEK